MYGYNDYNQGGQQFRPGPNYGQPVGQNGFYLPIKPPEQQAKESLRLASVKVGLLLILFIITSNAGSFIAQLILGSNIDVTSVNYNAFSFVYYFAMFLVPVIIYAFVCRRDRLNFIPLGINIPAKPGFMSTDEEVRAYESALARKKALSKSRARDYIVLSLLTLATTFSMLYLSNYIEAFFNSFGLQTNMELFEDQDRAGIAKLLYNLQIIIAAPISEEIFFRGALMHSLRRYGDSFAITVSAVMFGLMHGNIFQIPHAFVGGLIFGYIVCKRGNLMASVILHFINNVFSIGLSYALEFVEEGSKLYYILNVLPIIILIALGIIALAWMAAKDKKAFKINNTGSADTLLPGLTAYKTMFLSPTVIIYEIFCVLTIIITLTI